MPSYGKRSRKNLSQAHKDLQVIFNQVIKYFDCSIICGHRTKEAQTRAFNKGFSKVKFPNSKHNLKPSMAVDAVPYPIKWKDTRQMLYFGGHVVGVARMLFDQGKITHVIRYGGDWDRDTDLSDQRFNDLPHFELIKP